jgi:hypothetical protein
MAAKQSSWRHPAVFFTLFASLAIGAFGSLRLLGGTTGSVLEDVYRSIGLFIGNGYWAFESQTKVNTLFKVLATATPIVTFIGFIEVVTGGVIPFIIRQRALTRLRFGARGHVVCGLTGQGLVFARAVARRRSLIFILDDLPDPDLADEAYRDNIPILPLRGLDQPNLANRLFQHCDFVSFLPSTDQQVDLVARINARLRHASERSFWFLTQERGLSQRLEGYLRFTAANNAVRPRFFDMDALAARQVLTRHPLDILADVAGQPQIHLAIIGFGALGRAIVKEAARVVVTLPSLAGVPLKVTVIDTNAEAAAAALEAEDPQIRQLLELHTVSLTVQPAGLGAPQLDILPPHVTAYFVTVGNTELAFATAVSLRHWLLEPPAAFPAAWRAEHPCVPIMVRVKDWGGLGRLIRSNVDWPDAGDRSPELPDGIYGFAVAEDIFDPAFMMSDARETGARVLHKAYSGTQEQRRRLSENSGDQRADQREWRELASDLRDLNLYGYDHIPLKARAIGHRVVAGRTPGIADGVVPPEVEANMKLLSRLEHRRYLAERVAGGWRHADTRCDELRVHPDLVDWADLPDAEKSLDEDHVRAVLVALDASGLHMVPALYIGVAGYRRLDSAEATARLRAELAGLLAANPGRAPVVLTTLAPGLGIAAAEAAGALGVPWMAVLPVPFELYKEDFSDAERRRLQKLVAFAERYLELPLRSGKASELTRPRARNTGSPNLARRAEQYALANAYMVERAHALIAAAPENPEDADAAALRWWGDPHTIPAQHRSAPYFFPRPRHRLPAIVIDP